MKLINIATYFVVVGATSPIKAKAPSFQIGSGRTLTRLFFK